MNTPDSKPDLFMPFDGPKFFEAVKSWPHSAIVAYLKALNHYWFHLGCEGLPDDTEKLRRICECDRGDWEEVLILVFDNDKFFKQDSSGKWRQKRSDEEWNRSVKLMNKRKAASLAGVKARWG